MIFAIHRYSWKGRGPAIKEYTFLKLFRKKGWSYGSGILLLVLINALLLAVPKLIGESINAIADHNGLLTQYILYFVVLVALIMALKFSSRHLLLGSIRYLEYDLRKAIFDKALHIKTSYYEKYGPGKVMALMTNDVMAIRLALGLGIMLLVDAIFFGIFAFIIMGQEVSYTKTLIMVAPMLPVAAITLYITGKMRKRQKVAQASFSSVTEFTQELFMGMDIIRAFNKEFLAKEAFQEINRSNLRKNMDVALLDSIIAPLTFIAPFSCVALNMYISGSMVAEGALTVGDFVALNGYILFIVGPLMGLGSLATVTQKGLASVERIREFMGEADEEVSDDRTVLPLGDIEIRDVSFSYEGTSYDALSHVSTTIKKGEFVGIVGRPGSGKTTLFKLLLRLQDVPKDRIFIDHRAINAIPLAELRQSISYVPQTSYIYSSTVQGNIAFGAETIDEERVHRAAERAALDLSLEERVKSEGSKLKENGKNLSGGQKQRVALARGFYKDAPYLLLDDPFSALDFKTAAKVLGALRGDREQTILCISQRLEVLTGADRILVFSEGKLVEEGTHAELMALEGEYYRLYTLQEKGAKESAAI